MRSKVLAVTLIVLTVLGTGVWHVEGDDPDFLPEQTSHNHATHHASFRAPAPAPADGGQCALCHWLQLFRAGQVRDAGLHDSPLADNVRGLAIIAGRSAAARLSVPSRAPPA
jgi:hypothetical protein